MIIDLLTIEERKLFKKTSFKKDEILYYENEVCDYLGIVNKGVIKISSFTFSGNEVIYNLLKTGEMFGNNLLFSSSNKYRGNVKGNTDGELYVIHKSNLIKILMNNESFLKEYLSTQAEFTKSLNTKIKLLSFDNAKERLLYYLFIHNNVVKFKSITSLAHELYLSREATSRLISSLEKENIVKRNKDEIRLIENL